MADSNFTNTPAPAGQSRSEAIKSLTARAEAVAAMLPVLGMLPDYDLELALITCGNLAEDVNKGIYALTAEFAQRGAK